MLGETTQEAYPMPLHALRETTSLGGERAQQAAYSLPSPGAATRRERLLALHTVCLQIFPHSPQTLLAIRQYSFVDSARSEEKSAGASRAQSLRAAALVFSRALFSTPSPLFWGNVCL